MSSGQKVIKILALILAGFIIVNIFSAVIWGLAAFSGFMYVSEHHDNVNSESLGEFQEEVIKNIENLNGSVKIKIDLGTYHLEMKKGSKLSVETNNKEDRLTCMVRGNTLELKEKNRSWFGRVTEGMETVVIYVPENITLEELDIEMGVGKATIQDIDVKDLDIDAGAGKMLLNNVIAQRADVDGGAGSFETENCNFNNLDLDCGVGVTKIAGNITGNSKISCGVGRTEINLVGKAEDYTIRTETGLGAMVLNGEKCSDNARYGNGESKIEVEAGVGSVEITTK